MEEKMRFISQFISSINRFEDYSYFIKQPLRKAFLYLFLVSIIFGGMYSIKDISDYNADINASIRYIKSNVPEFQLTNGELEVNVNMPYVLEKNENEIYIIDTSEGIDETILDGYKKGVFISKYEIVYKENMFQTRKFNFSSLQGMIVTKDDVVKKLPYLKWLSIIIIIFGFIIYCLGKIISAFILSVCGIAIGKILKYKIRFKNLYKLSIYSLSLPIVINTLIDLTGLTISYFFVIYYGLALIYLWRVIETLKSQEIIIVDPESSQNENNNNSLL